MSKNIIPKSEVQKHTTRDDMWIVVHGRVYDISKFAEEHPGGDEVLLEWAGDTTEEPTKAFDDIMHSPQAIALMEEYYKGDLEGAVVTPVGPTTSAATATSSSDLQTSNQGFKRVLIPVVLVIGAYLINWWVTK